MFQNYHAQTRLAVLDRAQSKVIASNAFVIVVQDVNVQLPGDALMANPGAMESTNWNNCLQSICEERIGRRFGGSRVLNSYWVSPDALYKYFEVIMIDIHHNAIRRDPPKINWLCSAVHKLREMRGLTAAGKSFFGIGNG